MITEKEYFKITEMRKTLEILKRDKCTFKVTRSEIDDKQTKINLMQEAEKFGRESQKAKYKLPFKMTNHEIGCMLESYIDIIEFRGFKNEAKQLLEIASRMK